MVHYLIATCERWCYFGLNISTYVKYVYKLFICRATYSTQIYKCLSDLLPF